MDIDLHDILEFLHTVARSLGAEVASPWFYLQLGLILAAAGVGFGISLAVGAHTDLGSVGVRWPAPLRLFVRTLVGSAGVAVFAAETGLARLIMTGLTWPSRSYLLAIAARLALAWLAIRLVTSGISNGFIVRAVSITAWLIAALSILDKLQPAMDALDSVSLTLGGLRFTPLVLINFAAILVFALWLSNIFSNFAESRIIQSADLTPSIQVLLVKMIRLGLIILAVVIAMGAVGINLSALAIFSGAAGVGIGFGLQKIVANFISGIILLVDKSVKPGDLITVGDNSGRISAMKTRYISVAAGDGREFLIPNEDLVTQKVTNWTYTDKNTLVKVVFATNYEADPRLVCQLATTTAAAADRALKSKPPNCLLTEFAETGMKFSLTFWVADPGDMDLVKSEVMLSLWDAFRREGIHVPYPVRELRVRGGALPVETVVEASS
ncbi:MAG: mechanosensitive ion channel [Bradyrhizobium sp.]|uniref:mechanosensitive ion channel family protein n=1 Tax=Bradyrhizobium sp. TaxID=376 RepID=UPI001DD19963|nr:mechanosensitive ion channel domain-containing protein [Bradyrhizobium sp.]MBV9560032.1 mechanosensitive ion channel [Bradyrhizobium sp.]